MTINHFNTLSLTQKTDTVWEWGFYITSLHDEDYTKAFFLLADFLVEVIILRADNSTDTVKGIKITEHNKHLVSPNILNNPLLKVLV